MYEGKIYRPWTEGESMLIQVTLGCSNNKCTFCTMFRDKRFRRRTIDDIFRDIDELRRHYRHVESIFLIDGNVMVLPTSFLLKVLAKIKATFPEVRNIALYSGLHDLCRKSPGELKELKDAGVSMAYAGLESGDRLVLEQIRKGMTPEQAIEGMALAKESGIRMLLSFIFGLGGRERSREHIEATTALLNRLEPEEIAPMSLSIQPGSELEQDALAGRFVPPTPMQLLEEERYLLTNLADFKAFYWGDHGNNLSPKRGWFPDHRAEFLRMVEHAIAKHPIAHQEALHTLAW